MRVAGDRSAALGQRRDALGGVVLIDPGSSIVATTSRC
jgi:hypothetical protein